MKEDTQGLKFDTQEHVSKWYCLNIHIDVKSPSSPYQLSYSDRQILYNKPYNFYKTRLILQSQ